MKQSLFFTLGSVLVGIALGWTYHYSQQKMNWQRARKWCQKEYTDMVVIQNQEENNYVMSILPNKTRGPYYWIGITRKHKDEDWTWIGNNSTWVGEHSWADNEPNNNEDTEFCVEIYANEEKRGKWNDEKCSQSKYVVCYKAQCNATSCKRGRCTETINNTTCICEPGFVGEWCHIAINSSQMTEQEIHDGNTTDSQNTSLLQPSSEAKDVECPPLSVLDNGHLRCSGGNNTLNSTCQFYCRVGLLMIGSATVSCGATGLVWSGPRPICADYKPALMAIGACSTISALCCICLCWMKRRKRKKLAQVRHLDDGPSSEAQGWPDSQD